MGKMFQRVKDDPRVSDAFRDSDGYWVYLKAGWDNGNPSEHVIVEDRNSDVVQKMRGLRTCVCQECVTA